MPSVSPAILVDFPDAAGRHVRRRLADPVDLVIAERLEDVRGALAQIETHAKRGRYAAGFVAYDAAPAFDQALHIPGRAATPLLWFGIFNEPADAAGADPPEQGEPEGQPRGPVAPDWQPHVSRSSYNECIYAVHNGILDGAFYQVNHTLRLRTPWVGDPLIAYEAMHRAQPDGYGMYVDLGRFQILSASPELLFSRTGRDITTRPMKGTAARGRWLDEDNAVACRLGSSEKDRAENVMIVDLVRSDLGRIAEPGSVKVRGLFDLERHPTVWQMTSTIAARSREGIGLPEIFAALFPSGSVVGAPKIAAARWIADQEGAARGVYCGAIGVVHPGGDCIFNVAIRTVVIDAERCIAEYGVGGGITIDSTADGEYEELLTKAALLHTGPPPTELLETMRLSDGMFHRRERHLKRLADSAEYFGFAAVTQAASAALDERARETPHGDYRVRLVVTSKGIARALATRIEDPPGALPELPLRGPLDLKSPTPAEPLPARPTPPAAPIRCAVARTPVSSLDRLLYHKTACRDAYEARRAEHPEADEVILVNERGELTECSIGNLVVEIGGDRLTPPRNCGLLAGTFRDELLDRGAIREQVLRPSDLRGSTGIWRVNSLREWVPLSVMTADAHPNDKAGDDQPSRVLIGR